MPRQSSNKNTLTLDVLQQFRVIYGSMRQYFREVEERCGLPGSQMWLLQEVQKTPYIGVTELARRLGVTAVPTFIVGDQRLVGAQPYEALEWLVRQPRG